MPELEDRLRSDARVWQDAIDRPALAPPRLQRAAAARPWLAPALAAAAVLLFVAVGALWSRDGGRPTPAPAAGTTDASVAGGAPLSVELILDRTTARAGEVISGRLLVSNVTDEPVGIAGTCNGWGAVGLTNDDIPFTPVWTAMGCAEDAGLSFAPGTTAVPIQIRTRYRSCNEGPSTGPGPTCETDPVKDPMPPLPAGQYTTAIVFIFTEPKVALPAPITVTLTD